MSGVFDVAVNVWKASPFAPDACTISCERQTTADRRMLLATPEHKVVVTYFVCAGPFCNFLCDKKLREKDLQKEHKFKVLRVRTAVKY